MKKRHLFWLMLPSYWILTAVAILAVSIYAYRSMSDLHIRAMERNILTQTRLLSEQALPLLTAGQNTALDDLCKRLGVITETRFTLITPNGQVLGDSSEFPEKMEPHGDRPEIRQALAGTVGTHQRFSRTLREEMLYLAIPLRDPNGNILCAVRAALPMSAIESQLDHLTSQIIFSSVAILLLAMIICVAVVRRITSPLYEMSDAAMRFATGDFNRRIPAQQNIEFDQLASSLNTMSEQLSETLSTLNAQRNEQQAVLSSMDEGVLAIDRRERIIHLNRVAGHILGIDPEKARRELIQQAIRFVNLQEFIKAVLGSQKPIILDLNLIGETEKQIQAHGTVLRNATGDSIGALIILRDVSQLRHLERVRSDFVANVSHELKTPITSIKGFVETLLSDDWKHPPEVLRFLEIVNQQAGRLNAIIDDLLTLSRLEQKGGRILRESCNMAAIIHNAIYLCQLQAAKKNIVVEMHCPEKLELTANAPLFEQALVNLIINAIKYSEPDKKVTVSAEEKGGKVTVRVKDQGFGIEPKHLDRLFERFYRVDTARSRKLGGTGLGLSIVKHIVQAHTGTIKVESKLGLGSTFTIQLAKNGPESTPKADLTPVGS